MCRFPCRFPLLSCAGGRAGSAGKSVKHGGAKGEKYDDVSITASEFTSIKDSKFQMYFFKQNL